MENNEVQPVLTSHLLTVLSPDTPGVISFWYASISSQSHYGPQFQNLLKIYAGTAVLQQLYYKSIAQTNNDTQQNMSERIHVMQTAPCEKRLGRFPAVSARRPVPVLVDLVADPAHVCIKRVMGQPWINDDTMNQYSLNTD